MCARRTRLQGGVSGVDEGVVLRLVRPVRLIDSEGEGSCRRLVEEAKHVEPRDVRRVQHRPALLLCKEARDREDAVGNLGSLVLLSDVLQLPKQRRQQLLRAEGFRLAQVLHTHDGHALGAILHCEAEAGRIRRQLQVAVALAQQPLELPDRVLGLHAHLLASGHADEALQEAHRGEGDSKSKTFRRRSARQALAQRSCRTDVAARTCLEEKLTMLGVSRLLSLLSTTSIPFLRANPTTEVLFPTSMPSTLILQKQDTRPAKGTGLKNLWFKV